jgi:hypothetical protein
MEWITKAKDLLSLGARQVFIIVIVAWALLLLPQSIAEFLGINEFRTTYHSWIGVAALVATAYIIAGVLFDAMVWVFSQLKSRRSLRHMQVQLYRLTPDERRCIHQYIEKQTQTVTLNHDDGVVNGLVAKDIIYRAGVGGTFTAPFNLRPWVYDYLSKHPESILDDQ